MTTACITNKYFSGQGALLLAARDEADGSPQGFRPVGNVSSLSLSVETTDFEHKESCSGARGIDLTITQETNVTANFVMESLERENLATALFGTSQSVTGAAASNEQVEVFLDRWVRLAHIKVSTVVVGDDAVPTITYELGKNYELDLDAGAIFVYTDAEQTARGAANNIANEQVVFVDYNFATQDEVEAVTSAVKPLRWARFHGLNTADANKPLVVDIYKLEMQPLAELALINDEITQMEVSAKALVDTFRVSGSQFFSVKRIP